MRNDRYTTSGGIEICREIEEIPYRGHPVGLAERLDRQRGVLLSSSFEFPGRYTRWDMGFSDPPIVVSACGRRFAIESLNPRGEILLAAIASTLRMSDAVARLDAGPGRIDGEVHPTGDRFPEELRSRQPSVFSVLRALVALFASPEDAHLGLYGAFGYDLVFQFEPMELRLPRADDQRDLVLFLPDEILVVDHMGRRAERRRYDFVTGDGSTAGLPRTTAPSPYVPEAVQASERALAPGDYALMVDRARQAFARGDLFEVVLGQLFSASCRDAPSEIFRRLRGINPAPYGALMNLGGGEFLVAASPEMFVRVNGKRIETCPISGTIRRGNDALEDAERIRELLNSRKDESELTMCTDVDRNDKSRVCQAGSVRVIGRRQIEMYARLIHTVDHVEGTLRPEFDALDGFLSHTWAVTVTGAPKRWAIRHIEQAEQSARRWYGGAFGGVTFDGNMNTGLTLRTIRMKDGIAEVRAGATLLHDSVPEDEEAEVRLKASAMFEAISSATALEPAGRAPARLAKATRVLLIDHEDSFVHTLAAYFRTFGADVTTLRPDLARSALANGDEADLVVLSPGPGRPTDFDMAATLSLLVKRRLPVFGVCLGLQGLVEHFGGVLNVLPLPKHGKPSEVRVLGGRLFEGLPKRFTVGRYHSLHARRSAMPAELTVTAETAGGVVMAIEHSSLPIAAVQFHPESIMTSTEIGYGLISRVLMNSTPHPKVRR